MLSTTAVTFDYGSTPVLRGVSMDVPDRGFVGILGPNGSGKTTMLKVLAGTRKPAGGQVLLDGQDLRRTPRTALARRMAVVPQETHLAFDYSVLEVVMMGRYPHLGTFEVEGPRDYSAARQALAATGTADFEQRPFATLSGGEKQRVVIAGALAQVATTAGGPAPILLLDEPTAALDLAYQLEIASLLRELRQRLLLSIVLSTHDLNFAASLCESLVLLKDGRVLDAGPTERVLSADGVRRLYSVNADVRHHDAAGHLVVTPISRARAGSEL
jgi:iron complex transport system ATP-binding protein